MRSRVGWRAVTRRLGRDVDHDAVDASVSAEGVLGGRYLMMTGLSAAIALLGLLLSSPAVVIGAMLLSPLMGPIVLLGFALWTLDGRAAFNAVISLAAGFGLALVIAIALTVLSPLKEPTTEILARTRPTLFDLLVAVFSGVAGGYAVIKQRGETVIGVAIATALMPPISTVGFGVGIENASIAMGALLLFATNLIAIAAAAGAMAALYGFRSHYSGAGWWRRAAVFVVLIALCVPLTVSLQTIAVEGRGTAAARRAIADMFGPKARVSTLTVRDVGHRLNVQALVATPKFVASASRDMAARLKAKLHIPTTVSLDQLVIADPARIAAASTAAPVDPSVALSQRLHDAVPFPSTVSFDPKTHTAIVLLDPGSGLDLQGAFTLEQGLRARASFAGVTVTPPVQPLAPVAVIGGKGGSVGVSPALRLQVWALQRWRVAAVEAALCPSSRHPEKTATVHAALQPTLQPAVLTVSRAPRADCSHQALKPPFVLLSPAAAPTAAPIPQAGAPQTGIRTGSSL